MQVTELVNRISVGIDKRKERIEKLSGRFNLLINEDLPINKKYEQFAQEPICFFLYKKRQFFHRLIKSKAAGYQ